MKTSIFVLSLTLCNIWLLQAQSEGQIRMEEYQIENTLYFEENQEKTFKASTEEPKKQIVSTVEARKIKISSNNKKKIAVKEYLAIKRNLKASFARDSLPNQKSPLQKLGCFLREPLDLITLGVEMFELTKPPKSPFLIILYVIYIVPLFAIITSFIIGGILGLASFILACGLFAFLLYWLTLFLLGIALTGNLILWGVGIAFVLGLILYLLLTRLC